MLSRYKRMDVICLTQQETMSVYILFVTKSVKFLEKLSNN